MNFKFLIFAILILGSACEEQEERQEVELVCRIEKCNTDEDPYCECNSPECETYCGNIQIAALLPKRGGRICGIINGCIPPIDLRLFRIISFTTNPAASVSYIVRAGNVNNFTNANQLDGVFAKGQLESFDEKTNKAVFKYEVVEPKLAQEELIVATKVFTKENGEETSLMIMTDTFPKGHFGLK